MLIALHKNARTTPAVRAEIAAIYCTCNHTLKEHRGQELD